MSNVVILILVIFLSVLLGRIESSWGDASDQNASDQSALLCPDGLLPISEDELNLVRGRKSIGTRLDLRCKDLSGLDLSVLDLSGADLEGGEPHGGRPRGGKPQGGEPRGGKPHECEPQVCEPRGGKPQACGPYRSGPHRGEPLVGGEPH